MQREGNVANMAHLCQLVLAGCSSATTCQIGTSTELAARARQHDDPVFGARRDRPERLQQLVPHLSVDRILLCRPVQCDGDNPYRKFVAKPADYVFVVAAVLAVIGLLAWAILA
jgi:hypothetical protein